MKHFRCGDVVPGCQRTFTGSEEEILHLVSDHARHDHGMSDIPAELAGQVQAAMIAA